MDAQAPSLTPLASNLSKSWAGAPAWRILDTQFDSGQAFLAGWKLWQDDPNRPRLLHYVALAPIAPLFDDLRSQGEHAPEWQSLLNELAPHWFGLLPGFHRISLQGGRVLLTLCIGPLSDLLRQLHFYADMVYLGSGTSGNPQSWDTWTTKVLTRCCRRGTRLRLHQRLPSVQSTLTQCGFVFDSNGSIESPCAVFDPRWTIKNTRNTLTPVPPLPGTCAVVGAGLAGASVAASLARRGWKVIVLDGAPAPASGASGLPVGLVAPHDSVDDCKLSRLSRAGVRLMLGEAKRYLIEAQDWAPSGSTEYRIDGSSGLPEHWSFEGAQWSQPAARTTHQIIPSPPADDSNVAAEISAISHTHSAWIKPAQLVRAWLDQANITVQSNAQVTALARANDQWTLQNSKGDSLARVDRVVFANANEAFPLLQKVQQDFPELPLHLDRIPAVHGVRGQMSFGRHADSAQVTFPAAPINGAGSVIPNIPTTDGLTWFVGSSFQPDTQPAIAPEKNHWANFGRLQTLNPELAAQLKPQFENHRVQHWNNTRCVTADRLPIVGSVGDSHETGIWVCAGMGSRGLSFSVLCAELLAAQWCGEPLPIELNLAQSFDALRSGSSSTA